MAISTAVTDLVKSLAELLSSALGAAYAIVHSLVAGFVGLLTGLFAFAGVLGRGVLDLVSGVGRFLTGNIVILSIIGVAGYAYMRFARQPQQQQGRRPAAANTVGAGKKTN
ncbi:hypothetical protein VTK26DRAFT_8891 [Humicola hyalothermophila]